MFSSTALADAHRYRMGEIRVGDHVRADPMHMNRWIDCTVTAVNVMPYDASIVNNYSVRCNSISYTVIADSDHVRAGGGGGYVAPQSPRSRVAVNSGGTGTYSVDGSGNLHWTGDFGVLSRAPWTIVRSAKQPYVKDAFSFYYERADRITRSMSCRRR